MNKGITIEASSNNSIIAPEKTIYYTIDRRSWNRIMKDVEELKDDTNTWFTWFSILIGLSISFLGIFISIYLSGKQCEWYGILSSSLSISSFICSIVTYIFKKKQEKQNYIHIKNFQEFIQGIDKEIPKDDASPK